MGALIIAPIIGEPYAGFYTQEWTLLVGDYYNMEAPDMLPYYLSPTSGGDEPTPDAISINGLFGTGYPSYMRLPTTPDTTTRIRFINTAAFSQWNVSIDGVAMRVIEVDGTPISPPYDCTFFLINVGQRTSVLVSWSDVAANAAFTGLAGATAVWLRVNAIVPNYPQIVTDFPPYEPDWFPYAAPLMFATEFRAVIDLTNNADPLGLPQNGNPSVPPAAPSSHLQPDANLLDARPFFHRHAPPATHALYMVRSHSITRTDGMHRSSRWQSTRTLGWCSRIGTT